MVMAKEKKEPTGLHVRVPPELKDRLDQTLQDRKITKQDGLVSLLEWFVEQDPKLQIAIMGTVGHRARMRRWLAWLQA